MQLYPDLIKACDASREVTRVTIGVFTIMVETGVSAGLSSCFKDPMGSGAGGIPGAGRLSGCTTGRLMAKYAEGTLLQRSLSMAALNASLPDAANETVALHGQDFFREKTGDGHLVIVGHFPFVRDLAPRVGRLSVIQEPPHLGRRGVAQAETLFPEADVVVITSSAFINNTIDDLLSAADRAYVVLLGATTPMHSLLFDYGVDALCGAHVLDTATARRGIMEGASFRDLRGFRRVTWFRDPSDAAAFS